MNDDELKQSSRKQQNEYFSTHPAHETRPNHLEKQLPNVKLIKLILIKEYLFLFKNNKKALLLRKQCNCKDLI